MKQDEPLVSIILPVCNASEFLRACIESITLQSYQNFEIIAIDDRSKDSSYAILRELKKQDSRLRIYKNKKRYGVSICLNRALKKAKGKYIALMDAKDVCSIDRIKRQVRFLLSHPKVVAVGTQFMFIDQKNKKIAKSNLPQEHNLIAKSVWAGFSLQFETAMINKQLLPKDLLYFKNNIYPFLYSDIFVKLLSYGELANLPWVLHYRRRLLDASVQTVYLLPTLIKNWVRSLILHDYRPSLRSLLNMRINTN